MSEYYDNNFNEEPEENLNTQSQARFEADAPQAETPEAQTSQPEVEETESYRSNPNTGYTPYPDYRQPRYEHKKEKSSHPMPIGAWIAIIVVCSLLAGMLGAGIYSRMGNNATSAKDTSTVLQGTNDRTNITINDVDTSKEMTAAELYAACVNSTVGITTQVTTNYWGYQVTSPASGSGFIYSSDGYIVTNYHVVEDASSINVTTYSGDKYTAELVGYDESNDVAVLKIEAENLSSVVIGDSSKTNVGDEVVAIGNPLGELTFSLTKGAVSALDRTITLSNSLTMKLLQTDCAINSGNSGGPLFNMYGEVIGITNAKYSSSSSGASIDNIGFAIPMNTVNSIIQSIVEKGYVTKPYVGVTVTDVSEQYLNYGLPKGAAVQSIVEGGPAEKGGLKVNDIITKADGNEITGKESVVSYVASKNVGDKIVFTVYRQGQTLDVTVTVEETTQTTTQSTDSNTQSQQSQQQQQGNSFSFPFNFGY